MRGRGCITVAVSVCNAEERFANLVICAVRPDRTVVHQQLRQLGLPVDDCSHQRRSFTPVDYPNTCPIRKDRLCFRCRGIIILCRVCNVEKSFPCYVIISTRSAVHSLHRCCKLRVVVIANANLHPRMWPVAVIVISPVQHCRTAGRKERRKKPTKEKQKWSCMLSSGALSGQ